MGNTIRPKEKVNKDHYRPIEIPKEEKSFEGSNGKKYTFLPAEVAMEVQEFSSLSVKDQLIKFRGKLTIELKSLPQENQMIVALRNGAAEKKEKKDADGNEVVVLTYHINQHVSWTPNLTLLPFDSQRVPICVELLHFKIENNRYYLNSNRDGVNITNEDNKNKREYFLPRGIHVKGLEDFKLYYYKSRYEEISEEIAKKKIGYSPQITVYFSLSRLPWNYYLTVLLPNFILQLLSITLFFTANIFEERLRNISVLILAIVSFLPTVRAGLPHIPYITLMDFIIYVAVVNVGLCTLETSIKRHNPHYENKVWMIIACCLVFLTTLVSGIFLIWKIIQWLWMERRMRERKSVTEEYVEIIIKKSVEAESNVGEDRNENQKPCDRRDQVAIQIGTGSGSGAMMKEDEELHEMKSLIPTEKRYVNREAQVRLETGKGIRFS